MPTTRLAWLPIVALAVSAAAPRLWAAEPAAEKPAAAAVSYFRDIRPMFQVHCLGCHQPAKAMGGLVMTNFEGLFKGGASEQAAIVPGKPDESNLVALITPADGKAEMPKDKEKRAKVHDILKAYYDKVRIRYTAEEMKDTGDQYLEVEIL